VRTVWKVSVVTLLAASLAIAASNRPTKPGQSTAKPAASAAAARSGKTRKPAPRKKADPAKPKTPPKPMPKPAPLPKLVDLGRGKCIPCKMMKPVLEELQKEYKGKLEVAYIDIEENEQAVMTYRLRSIPTQIFYDSKGKELSRHEGFFSKEDIIARFREHRVKLQGK